MSATKAQVTNQRVAEDLGVTHSAVSRIRTGDRHPSLELMVTIAKRYGWTTDRQVAAVHDRKYATEFEATLTRFYG